MDRDTGMGFSSMGVGKRRERDADPKGADRVIGRHGPPVTVPPFVRSYGSSSEYIGLDFEPEEGGTRTHLQLYTGRAVRRPSLAQCTVKRRVGTVVCAVVPPVSSSANDD